ncbi:unnamed protein product [Mytilus coruscus]|uniref:B box-type domain-containing protein n=1 Tax=Mytilus coruscus TaxID=42192 RepID=A0A6J8ETQ2_MYTCO|nr:unnamed protein product [Mytilus coruscus]
MAEAEKINTICECFLEILPSIRDQKGVPIRFTIETTFSVYKIIKSDWEHFKVQLQIVLEYEFKVKVINFELSHENDFHMLFICRFATIHENKRFQTLVDEGKVTIILTKYAENNGFAVAMGFDPTTNFKVQLSVRNSKTHAGIKEEKNSSRMCSFKTPKRENIELFQMASKHFCQPCETEDTFVPAIKWCTECEENLCKECFQFHKKGKATKNHHVLDISEAGIFPTLENQHCSKHSGMLLDLFCVDHDTLSCRQCMTEEHRACNKLLPLDVAAKDVGSSALVSDLLKDFELSVTALCSIESTIEKQLNVDEDQKIAKHKDITYLKARLCKQIEESDSVIGEKIETVSKEH